MRRAVVFLLLLTGCAAAPSRLTVGSPSPPGWTGTWAAAVQGGGRPFDDQTLRQVVHTSIGGYAARLHLTNEFGDRPLTIGSATIGAALRVTFGGRPSVTIPAGGTAVSDEAAFVVPADADVTVSLYLPAATGPGTRHAVASRHNLVAAGDQVFATELTGARTEKSWYFLSGLDVRGGDGAIVAFGASITDGLGSPFGGDRRWPDLLSDRLRASGREIGVLNTGLSGNRLTADDHGERAPARFDRDVLRRAGVRWVIISDDAINDLGAADPPMVDRITGSLRELTTRARAAGVRAICSTLTPFQGAGYWTDRAESGRVAVNAFLRSADSGCDAVLDQDLATRDPDRPARLLRRYDSGDHLHPSAAGLAAIADAVDLDWFTD
ncbi:SGNH/GDSL hydrolase family protein [Actinoplanes sichuanensis]|uniref:GDSL-type esterase/lipase family protein n=1 Tax=Actinoplanes sichuanensis TaxID=512349 RepID=A0ABW4A5J9_9ACTN|nr:GDSL-type esterase/lipase family protein [Actinoplanes sichuanensis]BEL02846.1 SGNH/GDSL hydrolase family protein [Actinoplanes sichuanensis]